MALNSRLQRLRSLLMGNGGREGASIFPVSGEGRFGPLYGGFGLGFNTEPGMPAPYFDPPGVPSLPTPTVAPAPQPPVPSPAPVTTTPVNPVPAPIAAPVTPSPSPSPPRVAAVPLPSPMDNRPFGGGPYIPARPDSTVTAGSVLPDASLGPRVSLAGPGQPNVNYDITPEQAAARTSQFGGQQNIQDLGGDYGPAGPPSAPIRSMSFPGQSNMLSSGTEVDIPVGQIQFWLERGDPEWLIRERLGLAPQTVGRPM